ncbi:MAG: hypothetical protein U0T82_00595 [Bacteroidales bacterium]
MKKSLVFVPGIFLIFILLGMSCTDRAGITGTPWHDSLQTLPGKIECEKYNSGGEGIAYHDSDSVNNGSGKLNPDDGTFYNTFRIKEGVDISYTKTNGIDDNQYNLVEPLMKQLYVGWTEPGEWINYTVLVTESGKYDGELMYTSRYDGMIAIDLDGKVWLPPVMIASTFNEADSLQWRQWHHWNRQQLFSGLQLDKGEHVLTLRTVERGNMNYDFIEFKKTN